MQVFQFPTKVTWYMVTNVKSGKDADCIINYSELTYAMKDANLTQWMFSKIVSWFSKPSEVTGKTVTSSCWSSDKPTKKRREGTRPRKS